MAVENHEKHLEFIQNVIARMGSNSFLVKGWSVTLVAALFALAARDSRPEFVVVAFMPCVLFWLLDVYYLQQEKLFRDLYDRVRKNDGSVEPFSMQPVRGWKRFVKLLGAIIAPAIWLFHAGVLAAIIGAVFVIKWKILI